MTLSAGIIFPCSLGSVLGKLYLELMYGFNTDWGRGVDEWFLTDQGGLRQLVEVFLPRLCNVYLYLYLDLDLI